ncbi:hypothetical protein QVD17_02233 [Tagetes erecta]|uniref:PORR domain-containing protein n=1 Tax=Tagetes erecta TaxID=13708 RepID=A0AAD8L8T9_TARER|nr:hypothetical protein QVD17_02233 [Tagetes erecta]
MQHHFILRYLRRPSRHDHHHHHRHHYHTSSSAISTINWVRDRALDHAVEKERDLKPLINLKNLINSEPSKSLPLSINSDNRSSLCIPTRPIDFIRKYPSVFDEFLPGGIAIHPHIKLTPETLTLDAEEQIFFQSDMQKKDVANRLLKLLMIGRMNKIPLTVVDRLKWDLGLPNDYVQTVVPLFPECFQVKGDELELVCWSDELAVSVMETKSLSSFPVQYSRGFEMDNKFKKWVDDWQKLPYISPYENASSLQSKSDEADKWIVGLMHEVLHLLVPKKTEKDNLLFLGEYLGVRSRFKKALLQHPGIFYVSSKLHTHTVVLREGYKRDLLVSKPRHPLMNLRSSYIYLMNMVKEKSKSKDADVVGDKKLKDTQDPDGDKDGELSETMSENEEDDFETECDSDDDDVNANTPTKRTDFEGEKRGRRRRSDDGGESEDLESTGDRKNRGRTSRTVKFNDSRRRNTPNSRVDGEHTIDGRSDSRTNRRSDERSSRRSDERFDSRKNRRSDERSDSRNNRRSDERSDSRNNRRSDERSDSRTNRRSDGRSDSRTNRRSVERSDSRNNTRSDERSDSRINRRSNERSDERFDSRTSRRSEERSDSRNNRRSDRRVTKETHPRSFLRTEAPGARASRGRSSERTSASRTRETRF